jgi:hypothetical protein
MKTQMADSEAGPPLLFPTAKAFYTSEAVPVDPRSNARCLCMAVPKAIGWTHLPATFPEGVLLPQPCVAAGAATMS